MRVQEPIDGTKQELASDGPPASSASCLLLYGLCTKNVLEMFKWLKTNQSKNAIVWCVKTIRFRCECPQTEFCRSIAILIG